MPLFIGLAAGAAILLTPRRRRSGVVRVTGAPGPIWPLVSPKTTAVPTVGGKSIGAKRPASGSQTRYHAGVDLIAKMGTPVVATEPGTVVAVQGWAGDTAKALLLETDSGVVVNYGALYPNSWKEYGIGVGSRVKAGQPLGYVGMYPHGGQMLHFELYTSGTRKNEQWRLNRPPPENLIDPTSYLQRASRRVVA